MIASLKGKLLSKKPDSLIIEVGGIGYNVQVPLTLLSALPEEGADISLHIYTHVREDAIQLYGFQKEDDKRLFATLIGIPGIGPKIALSILSTISSEELLIAIRSEDINLLCKVPGLGRKTAHRLILELKEKLPVLKDKRDTIYEDTLSALINLGYKKNIAKDALDKAFNVGCKDIESLLKEALRYLTKS